jgi:hypothetical protein
MSPDNLLRLARRIAEVERVAVNLRIGEVTGVDPLDVDLGSSGTSYESVSALAGLRLRIDDVVAVLVRSHDLLVLGKITAGAAAAARVYHDGTPGTDLDIPNNAVTPIPFDSERYDYGGLHDTVNPSRLTPPEAGVYDIAGHIRFPTNSTGQRQLIVQRTRSGVTTTHGRAVEPAPSATLPTYLNIATQVELIAGDYVTLAAFQNSGGTLRIDVIANDTPEFAMARIA